MLKYKSIKPLNVPLRKLRHDTKALGKRLLGLPPESPAQDRIFYAQKLQSEGEQNGKKHTIRGDCKATQFSG